MLSRVFVNAALIWPVELPPLPGYLEVLMATPKLSAANLLKRGYFPRELPPPFTTAPFARWTKKNFVPSVGWTQCAAHNLARAGGLRRPLAIPNPLSHAALCSVIEKHWALFVQKIYPGILAASRPRVTRVLERAVVPRYRQRELPKLRALKRRGARYYLRTDISQFYPSVYTHSIPWALHTKAAAKATLGKTLGDEVDKALRKQQWGQTIGLPIGPDASFVIAELILACVDIELQRRHKKLSGFRFVDDYEFYFDSLHHGEDILCDIESILSQYALLLNPRKTRIEPLPASLEESWHVELSQFGVREGAKGLAFINDLVGLFSRAFELAAADREAPIMKYLLVRVEALDLGTQHWRTIEGLISAAIASEPSAMPAAVSLIGKARNSGKMMSQTIFGATLESIIDRSARVGHSGEVAWALWCAVAAGLKLDSQVGKTLSTMEDDVVALLAMYATRRKVLAKNSVDLSTWQALIDVAGVSDSDHWLLAYESTAKAWLPPTKHLSKEFKQLQTAKVHFFDEKVSKADPPNAARALPGGTLDWSYF